MPYTRKLYGRGILSCVPPSLTISSSNSELAALVGGGETGGLMRAKDCQGRPANPLTEWHLALKPMVPTGTFKQTLLGYL
jgi:hypothetical protein